MPSEAHPLAPGFGGHVDGDQGDHEGGEVGEEVGRVGLYSQGVGHHSSHHLNFNQNTIS